MSHMSMQQLTGPASKGACPATASRRPQWLGARPAPPAQRCRVQPQALTRGEQQSGGTLPPPQAPPAAAAAATAAAVDRRAAVLALLAAAAPATLTVPQPAAAAVVPAPTAPLPVPPLTETFLSPEGFAFDYPGDGTWVVAFDRSGSTGNGAVVVVGDFRRLITVSVFRTETIPAAVVQQGLTEEAGYAVCVEPQQRERGTMRFNLLRSEAAPGGAYEFEFSIESCAGDVEEGLGGKLRCLSAFGGSIPTAPRRHIGRCVLVGGKAYSLNASSPEDRWGEVGPLLRAVVATFRAA